MLQYDEFKIKLQNMEKSIDELKDSLNINSALEDISVLEQKTTEPGFWDDMENSQKILQKTKMLKNKVEKYEKLRTLYDDTLVLIEMANAEDDESFLDEITSSVKQIEKTTDDMTLETLLSGDYDRNNAILTLHPGAGGTEAQDWTEMLLRMYTRWAERHNYSVETMDYLPGDEAGVKSVTILISGENAYGYLKSEKGVHRLVRISPFDASPSVSASSEKV